MLNRIFLYFASAILLCGLVANCAPSRSGGSSSNEKAIPAFCSTVTTYDSPITITGNAVYEYRTNGNGAVAGPNPIRYAEVRVLDGAGSIIQCGATDASGNFSISLPNSGASVRVQVAARVNNSSVAQAYVLTDPTNNSLHTIEASVVLDGSKNIGTITAPATGTLQGGAFNILDQIINANDFMRTQTAGCNGTYSNCTPFSIAPLVEVYWQAGFNPGTYVGTSTGLSFYTPSDNHLYILGGRNGDIDSSDTDHFDNSIILHEYGHFIEDQFSITDSQGGPHSGNTILDPRLAWGEGWANFFQAAVSNNPVYRDTFGTTAGTSGVFFNVNLESVTQDIPSTTGEGNFREFSVTRLLWDVFDSVDEGAGVDQVSSGNPFFEIWTLHTSATDGFKNSGLVYRDMGLFHVLQNSLTGGLNWSSVVTGELHRTARTDYANTVTLNGPCPNTATIQAANISGGQPEDGSSTNSNQFASNDFYQFTMASAGTLSVSLNFTTNSGNPADLDLYVYRPGYVFGNAADLAMFSNAEQLVGQGSGSESASASVAAGTYLININVYTQFRLGDSATYTLNINGQKACPD